MAKWLESHEVTKPGIYLAMHKKDLPGNGYVVYLEKDPTLGMIKPGPSSDKRLSQKIRCKAGRYVMYYGPIPLPEVSKKLLKKVGHNGQ